MPMMLKKKGMPACAKIRITSMASIVRLMVARSSALAGTIYLGAIDVHQRLWQACELPSPLSCLSCPRARLRNPQNPKAGWLSIASGRRVVSQPNRRALNPEAGGTFIWRDTSAKHTPLSNISTAKVCV